MSWQDSLTQSISFDDWFADFKACYAKNEHKKENNFHHIILIL
jgi:hypothetical protein